MTDLEKERNNSQVSEPTREGTASPPGRDTTCPPAQVIHNHFSVPEAPWQSDAGRVAPWQREQRPRGRGSFFMAKLLRIAWEVGGALPLFYLNVTVLSSGLAELSPHFSAKASTLLGLGWMSGYLMWHKITTAQVLVAGFFIMMTITWKFVIKDLLRRGGVQTFAPLGWDPARSRIFWRGACGTLMVCDALLFFYGVWQSSQWMKQPSFLSALIATALYLAGVAVYAGVWLHLSDWEGGE